MNKTILWAATAGLAIACAEPSAPRASTTGYAVEQVSSRTLIGVPGADVVEMPAVKLYRTRDGSGIAGKEVTFTLEDPDGSTKSMKASTNTAGIATLPSWRLGNGAGRYIAVATIEGWQDPVVFRAYIPGKVVGIYDLTAVAGKPVPTGEFREGHYILYEGGVYNAFYNSPAREFTLADEVFGTYRTGGSFRIDFSREIVLPGSSPMIVPAGWAYLEGNVMTVQRGDWMDFSTERFELRPPG